MPGMNGPELAVELRKLQPGLQIVFMSGYTADTLTERALPPGSILIEKPFDADDLLATIRRSSARRRSPHAEARPMFGHPRRGQPLGG
jgi:FixJ family two-component response regulator